VKSFLVGLVAAIGLAALAAVLLNDTVQQSAEARYQTSAVRL
jgi:hypothetical protein